jgi:hypothetical protein
MAASRVHPEESLVRAYVIRRAIELQRATAPPELLSNSSSSSSIFNRPNPLLPPPWLDHHRNAPSTPDTDQGVQVALDQTDRDMLNEYFSLVVGDIQPYRKKYLSAIRSRDRSKHSFHQWMKTVAFSPADTDSKSIAHGTLSTATTYKRVLYRSIMWRTELSEQKLKSTNSVVSQLVEERWRYGQIQEILSVVPFERASPLLIARVKWLSTTTLPDPPHSPLTVVQYKARNPDLNSPFVLISHLHPANLCLWPKSNALHPEYYVIQLDSNADNL